MHTARAILISGAPGTGKSTLRRLAPAYFRSRFGEAAALDTDEVYAFFDPDWQMSDRERWYRAYDLSLATVHWLIMHGVPTVILASNGIYTVADVNRALRDLYPIARVYHITLDVAHDVLVERVRQRGDLPAHPPEWLAEWQQHIREHYRPWTTVIDTTRRTPEAVLDAIAAHCDRIETCLAAQVE